MSLASSSDGAVAGASVADTEADEDATYQTSSDTGATPAKSFEIEDLQGAVARAELMAESAEFDAHATSTGAYGDGVDANTAPMHMNALRIPAKLMGAPSSADRGGRGGGRRSRSSSRSRPGSRRSSHSPSPVGTSPSGDGASMSKSMSAASSLADDHLDPDILLDRLGFEDLDAVATELDLRLHLQKHRSSSSLPMVNERVSEASLDDSEGFRDLVYVGKKKVNNANSSGKEKGLGMTRISSVGDEDADSNDGADNNDAGDASTGEGEFDPVELLLASKAGGSSAGGKNISTMALSHSSISTLDVLEEEDEEEIAKAKPKGRRSRATDAAVAVQLDELTNEEDDDEVGADTRRSIQDVDVIPEEMGSDDDNGEGELTDDENEGYYGKVLDIPDSMLQTSPGCMNTKSFDSLDGANSGGSNDDDDDKEAKVDIITDIPFETDGVLQIPNARRESLTISCLGRGNNMDSLNNDMSMAVLTDSFAQFDELLEGDDLED